MNVTIDVSDTAFRDTTASCLFGHGTRILLLMLKCQHGTHIHSVNFEMAARYSRNMAQSNLDLHHPGSKLPVLVRTCNHAKRKLGKSNLLSRLIPAEQGRETYCSFLPQIAIPR